MFECKTCIEKEKRIVELKEQIDYLRSLVFPNNDPYKVTFAEREADAVLSAEMPTREETKDELDKAYHELKEHDKLIAGDY